jgi:hypothetical protein
LLGARAGIVIVMLEGLNRSNLKKAQKYRIARRSEDAALRRASLLLFLLLSWLAWRDRGALTSEKDPAQCRDFPVNPVQTFPLPAD